ncbi:hypothetical protein [Bradyrhizobium sp.]
MTKRRSFLYPAQGEGSPLVALRSVTQFLRKTKSRREVADHAHVDPNQLDDFINPRVKGGDKYKTTVPNNSFQRRLLNYILELPDLTEIAGNPNHECNADAKLLVGLPFDRSRVTKVSFDPLFRFFEAKRLADSDSSFKIAEYLAGQFYAFRYSSSREGLVKTYFRIPRPRRADSILTFQNFRLEPDDVTVRRTEGFILNIGENFVFFGFVKGGFGPIIGVKIVILHHGGFRRAKALSGLYISHDDDGSYDIGRMTLIQTQEKFKKENLGIVSTSKLPSAEQRLALGLSSAQLAQLQHDLVPSIDKGKLDEVDKLLSSFKLLSSINIPLWLDPYT